MQSICIKTKIKSGSVNNVKKWFKNLLARRNETLQTLENEGIVIESAFLDNQGDDTYIIYFIKAEDLDRAYSVFENSTLPIDLYFKSCWKEYCSGRTVLEELIDLDRFDG